MIQEVCIPLTLSSSGLKISKMIGTQTFVQIQRLSKLKFWHSTKPSIAEAAKIRARTNDAWIFLPRVPPLGFKSLNTKSDRPTIPRTLQ